MDHSTVENVFDVTENYYNSILNVISELQSSKSLHVPKDEYISSHTAYSKLGKSLDRVPFSCSS
jgi:hypothetical protein